MISEITIGECDEFRISRNLDLLVPNLTRPSRDLKKVFAKAHYFIQNRKMSYNIKLLELRNTYQLKYIHSTRSFKLLNQVLFSEMNKSR